MHLERQEQKLQFKTIKEKVFFLGSQGLMPDQIAEELGLTYESVVAKIVHLRKHETADFMVGKLRQDIKQSQWKSMDAVFANSPTPVFLRAAFKKVSSKYLKRNKEKNGSRVLFTLKEVAQAAGCSYSGNLAAQFEKFLQLNGVFVGVYTEKKHKDSDEINRMLFVPLVHLERAIMLLEESEFAR